MKLDFILLVVFALLLGYNDDISLLGYRDVILAGFIVFFGFYFAMLIVADIIKPAEPIDENAPTEW